MKVNKGLKILALLMGTAGIVSLGYLWKVWGERGLYADAHGTQGYTTSAEALLFAFGILVLVGAVGVLIAAYKKEHPSV